MNNVYSKTGKLVKRIYFGATLIWESLYALFKSRVEADGGAFDNSYTDISNEGQKLLLTPNGYKAGKLYSALPKDGTGDFTVNRNSTATYVGADGLIKTAAVNTPRIDYSTGEPMLLVEGQSTNYITDSVNMSSWTAFNNSVTYTPNAAIAPDGTSSANLLEFTSQYESRFEKVVSVQGVDRVFCIHLKSIEGAKEMRIGWGTAFTIPVLVTENWQRFYVPRSSSESGAYIRVQNETNQPQSILVWGAQVEKDRLTPTSYIPTNGSTVTRLADAITTTPPAGTTEIKETLADGTVNSITTIPATYQLPVGQIEKIEML